MRQLIHADCDGFPAAAGERELLGRQFQAGRFFIDLDLPVAGGQLEGALGRLVVDDRAVLLDGDFNILVSHFHDQHALVGGDANDRTAEEPAERSQDHQGPGDREREVAAWLAR